ncbi:MAG: ECF transporter S component [Erysipelotrichaceae bacterium]|nr:ECF transporter S component [Erysipelotrichaceae bacterium]
MNFTQKHSVKNMTTRDLVQTALLTALIFVVTRFVQIPIPLGYLNFGNCTALIGCLLVPSPAGIIAAGFGSALADLISYPVYTVPTLLIKGTMAFVFYWMMKRKGENSSLKLFLAALVSMAVPVIGYTITGGLIYGGLMAGMAQLPGLLVEYAGNVLIFVLMARAVQKSVGKKSQ